MDDLIIIGASAAGTAAGIYAARANLKARVLTTNFGGEVALSGEIENWPGVIHTDGIALAQEFEKHLKSHASLAIESDTWVESVTKMGDHLIVRAKQGDEVKEYSTRTVIAATGVHPRFLNIPGEEVLKNRGLSYCTVCDGPLFKGKKVATIGGGNSALESALLLSGLAEHVTLVTKNPQMKGEQVLIEKIEAAENITFVPNARTTRILGDQFVTGFEYTDTETNHTKELKVNGIFVHIGMIPNSEYTIDVEKTQFGEIKTNQLGETNIPGFFAAGDVTDHPFHQIVIAAGQGVTATLQAIRYLQNQSK